MSHNETLEYRKREHECGCHEGECHEGHDHHDDMSPMPETKSKKQIYILEGLGCANCAAKIEKKLQELPEVEYANIVFPTKQLRLAARHSEDMSAKIQSICDSVEDGITVTGRETHASSHREHSHEHHHEHAEGDESRDLFYILAGVFFFGMGFLLEKRFSLVSNISFVLAYLVLGTKILWIAVKNIKKGNIFDENFLMSIATLGAFAISQFEEAVGIMLFYRVGEWFEHRAVSRSRSQIMEALDLRPETVNLITEKEIDVIPAKDARIGNLLLVRPGERIPLDGTVVDGESRIDTSPVTGEPVPVKVLPGSQVVSGCLNTTGVLRMKVDKVLEESMVSKILDSVENAAASKPKIDRFLTRFSRVYTPFVVLLALFTAVVPSLITGNWGHWIYTALTFLVISCPCALVLSVPLAFFSGIGAGSRQGILFKGGVSLEALKHIKGVVMDKTGTLTKGNFALQAIVPSAAFSQNFPSLEEAKKALLSLAASCESTSTHPIAAGIMDAVREQNLSYEETSSMEEVPGHGIKAMISSGTLLCGNKKLLEEANTDLSEYQNTNYGTEVLLALENVYIGHLVIADAIKTDASQAIDALHRQNIMTAMLTGDSPESAEAVASSLGIKNVHAKLLPEDKLSVLEQLRKEHGSVMFVGDGINDAPVLAGADVGAAMGSGADAAIEVADVVFMTSDVSAIPESIRIARITGNIALQNVIFALTIKILVMLLGLAGYASMWFAVFADTGVAILCILNSIRILYKRAK